MTNPIIISLGGSLIIPDDVDTVFLSGFKRFIEEEVKNGREFILITGGGKTARRYQAAVRTVTPDVSQNEVDKMGIYSLLLNANFVRILFGDLAYEKVLTNPSDLSLVDKPVLVCGADPEAIGHSTDYDAVLFAKATGASRLINLSNIDFVYDKDPRKYPDAQKIEKISWSDFRKIIPEKWEPGLNSPFDPVAAKEAEKLGFEVAIMNGADISNVSHYIAGKSFRGTVISPSSK